jgi:ribonuclease R
MNALAQQLLDYISRPGYQPQKAKALAKNLGVTKKRREEFEAVLAALQQEGRIRISEKGRVQLPAPAGTLIGVIRKIASGAAYLIPHEPRPADVPGDVFIEAEDLKDAQNGDEVLVRLTRRRRSGGGRCGVVIDVLERATNVFVGTYYEEDDAGWVRIDGTDFQEPIWVGDPGAKGAREGDKVVVEMLRFPAHRQPGEGVLTKVLGPRGEPGVETQMILHEFGLPHEFPEEVLDEARLEAENFDETDLAGREDLTDQTIITIDPIDARDFDDAISLEREENGHWRLGVHIADVSAFVRPGSALDREAKLRGTSVYLPTLVIPMLPEVISNGLASLQEGRVRLTKSVFIEYTPEGIPVHTRFANTAVRVTRRFAYEEVLPILQEGERRRSQVPAKIRQLLADMHELAMRLRRRRIRQGYLELDMPEVKLDLDAEQRVIGAHEVHHDESHQIIEEFMLAANIAVARELTRRGVEFLRRVHGEPSPIKLQQLKELVTSLGFELRNPQSRTELQRLLRESVETPAGRAVHYGVLRSMKRAEYSALPGGHYALAEENYCHFTSPIRRYPDLTVHRLFQRLLTGRPTDGGVSQTELLQLARHCSTTERRADEAELELIRIKLLSYLESRIGEELEGTITGVDRYGFFVRGTQLPAEGLVHISTLTDHDYFDFDRGSLTLTGRRSGRVYRLGDRVVVAVAHVDVDRRELDFRLVKWLGGGVRRVAGGRKRRPTEEDRPEGDRRSSRPGRGNGRSRPPRGRRRR